MAMTVTGTRGPSATLETAQAGAKLSLSATLQWFREQRTTSLSEEKELRLESDDDRIKILTIHRSKGLEFPIVFLPFAWVGPSARKRPDHVAFHREDEEGYVRFVDVVDAGRKAWEGLAELAPDGESGALDLLEGDQLPPRHRQQPPLPAPDP